MISYRLLNNLQVSKKYLITDGICFYILNVQDNLIWCSELRWPSNDFFGIYMKDWDGVLKDNIDDMESWNEIKYNWDKTQPTYRYYAHISKLFVSATTHFSTYNLFFMGEYKEDVDVKALKKYCDIFKLSYKWCERKERLKNIYKAEEQKLPSRTL